MVTMDRARGVTLIDQWGDPLNPLAKRQVGLDKIRAHYTQQMKQVIRARYDAAQTFTGNENHWSNADHLDPISAANETVRRSLRSRSRCEIIENNPFLKGTILTITSDFVGRGPKLQITDKRLSPERRKRIEKQWNAWSKVVRLRQKLWRLRMAKIVDGEGFMRMYFNLNRRNKFPMLLDFQVLEADRIAPDGSTVSSPKNSPNGIVDGVMFDGYENALAYYVLREHPGGSLLFGPGGLGAGDWTSANQIIHWFRQDRGWLRGIPELAPSLALCAILRRYTMAVVRHAETAADLTAILETEAPPGQTPWTDGQGTQIVDDPFDVFPIEMGMMMNLPYGYKINQLDCVPLGVQYDEFVGSVLREITRPLLTPYNLVAGTSKDSNMASGVLDQNIYKGGQQFERTDCEEVVLDHVFDLFWYEGSRIPEFFGDRFLATDNSFRDQAPEHKWRWDRIGLDHTDPAKIANSLETLHNKRFLTDRDIQEEYYNRDVEDWRDEIEEDDKFREDILDFNQKTAPEPAPKPPVKKPVSAKRKKRRKPVLTP